MNSYRKLGDLLVSGKLITNLQLSIALAAQQTSNRRLGEILVERGFATEEQIASCLAEQYGYPLATLTEVKPQANALSALKADIALEHCVLPVSLQGEDFECIIADPVDVVATDVVTQSVHKRLVLHIAPRSELTAKIRSYYGLDENASQDSSFDGFKAPTRFGSMRPRKKIGSTTLFDAFDHQLERKVTLAAADAGSEASRKQHRLVQAAARVPSNWVTAVHDWFEYEDHSWAIFERLEGESLAHILRTRGPRTITQATELVAQLAEGVDSLNQHGGHCGLICPDNILIRPSGAIVTPLVEPGTEYQSPEIEMGDSGTVMSDIFVLGTVLWECILGENPHVAAAKKAGVRATWAEPNLNDPTMPTALSEVLSQCLAKEPENRFPSTILLANALRSYNWAALSLPGTHVAVGDDDRQQLLSVITTRSNTQRRGFWQRIFGRAA